MTVRMGYAKIRIHKFSQIWHDIVTADLGQDMNVRNNEQAS